MKTLRILVKFPTRSRPHLFLKRLGELVSKSADPKNINYLVSYDNDDATMTEAIKDQAIKTAPGIVMYSGTSRNKIHACNRDVEKVTGWDIIVLMSDDMECQVVGWDMVIRQAMIKHFPDTDGMLWFNDGYQPRIATMTIFGKKYFDRFGFLYHNDYTSLFCDEEQTRVAEQLGKVKYFETCIFKHQHCMNNPSVARDALYDKNEKYYRHDEAIYKSRLARNFDL